MDRDVWMTSTETAELADVSTARLMGAVNAGELPAYRIGRRYKFRRGEVEAWIAEDVRRGERERAERERAERERAERERAERKRLERKRAEEEARRKLRAEAVRRYLDGESSKSIGPDLGVSPNSVTAWVRAAGGTVRRRGGSAGQSRRGDDSQT